MQGLHNVKSQLHHCVLSRCQKSLLGKVTVFQSLGTILWVLQHKWMVKGLFDAVPWDPCGTKILLGWALWFCKNWSTQVDLQYVPCEWHGPVLWCPPQKKTCKIRYNVCHTLVTGRVHVTINSKHQSLWKEKWHMKDITLCWIYGSTVAVTQS